MKAHRSELVTATAQWQANADRRWLTGDSAYRANVATHWVARYTWPMGMNWLQPQMAKAAPKGPTQR